MNKTIHHDHRNDGIDRRGFLECMTWAGTGVVWSLGGGVAESHAFGQTSAPGHDGGFSFVQISDSHIGFNKPANPDVSATLRTAVERINALEQSPDFIIHTGDLTHSSKPEEAFLRAFRLFAGFHGSDGRAWLLTVVRNTCFSWLGRKANNATHRVGIDERVHRPAEAPQNTEQTLVMNSRLESLKKCVESLPAEYREIIVMREMEELSYKEISEAAGLPTGTVMSRLSRGRARLLECMEANR